MLSREIALKNNHYYRYSGVGITLLFLHIMELHSTIIYNNTNGIFLISRNYGKTQIIFLCRNFFIFCSTYEKVNKTESLQPSGSNGPKNK